MINSHKKIVHVSFQDPDHIVGGQGWAVFNLCKEQIRRRFQVEWLSPYIRDEKPGEFYYLHHPLRVTKLWVSDQKILSLYANNKQTQAQRKVFGDRFVQYIKNHCEYNDCVIHLHGFIEVPRRAFELRQAGYNVISTFHMLLSPRIDATKIDMSLLAMLREIEREAIKANTKIIVNSVGMADEIRQVCPGYEGRLYVLRNGVGEEYFDKKRGSYNLSSPIVTTYGRISPEKGFDLFIEAAKSITKEWERQHKKAVQFVIFGNNDEFIKARKEYLRTLYEAAKYFRNITIIAHSEGIYGEKKMSLIDQSTIGVVSSLYEPFGLVIPEFMSREIPVITTLTAGAKDILQRDSVGETPYGLLVDMNSHSLADAIIWLLEHPEECRIMGQHALERSQDYRWSKIVDEMLKTYGF